ncbi:MAG TPA: FtsX-like permease family protein [Puia sp.]|nr:FtsX-like permease family protein [Puia sp.]
MLRNFFTVAWRNFVKSIGYSVINTFGLSIGMAVALLIGLWIWDELSFDHYHTRHSRIAQIMTTQTFNGETGTGQATSQPVGPYLRTHYPADFQEVARGSWNGGHVLAVGDKKITKDGMYVEPNFTKIITLRMVAGNADALKDPSTILLCESAAKALFDKEDPMNKTVKVDNKAVLKVGGVFADPPRNSSFYDTKLLMAWDKYVELEDWMKRNPDNWGNHSWPTFALLKPGVNAAALTAKIKDVPKAHNKDGAEALFVQPMDNWHLYSDFKDGHLNGGRIRFVWLFGIIGVFVLLLACINFMNLSTARSEKRAREVGIRKTVGSLRGQIMGQFLCESVLVALLAFVLAILWVWVSLRFFNQLSDKDMQLPWGQPLFWILGLGFTIFTGLLAGSYPAFYLSGFEPIAVLKGTFKAGKAASLPRKILVVVQFTVSITLIIGTILVFRQISYAKSRPVGYDRSGLITVYMNTPDITGHYDVMRNDLLNSGGAIEMCESSSPATDIWSSQIGFDWPGKDPKSMPLFDVTACTHDFGKTVGWSIKEGRDFDRNFITDSGGLILNEEAVKLIGIQHPVGMNIRWDDKQHKVVGVVRDLVMSSPYAPIKPGIFFLDYGWANVITVRLNPVMTTQQALNAIEPVFKKYNPGAGFEYNFVDEDYAKKFNDEKRIGSLASVFAILAIFISCLGLFGLASFVAEQRTREIGVRKVLGASLFHLWQMLSVDFLVLVVISCLIAIPISWYFLHQWLQQYEYRTPMSWWAFAAASVGALVITLVTVSYQAVRAALMNPVASLRTE